MRNLGRLLLKYWQLTGLFTLFAVLYVLETLLVAPAKTTLTKYQIGSGQVHALQLAVVLPYVVIWIIGLVGYLRLHEYTQALGDSKDGRAFRTVNRGVLWFVLWLPIAVFISTTGNIIFAHKPEMTANVVRIENYLNLLILVPAFWYIHKGAKRLVKTLRGQIPHISQRTTAAFISFAAFYTFVTLEDSARRIAAAPGSPASYYLPDWLIVLTLVIPRLIMWYFGLLAVQYIRQYRKKVPGVIYQRALQRLAFGIGGVVLMIIMLRLTGSLTHQLSHLSLGAVLLAVYVLLAGLAVGYVLLAKGARQLQQIEEA